MVVDVDEPSSDCMPQEHLVAEMPERHGLAAFSIDRACDEAGASGCLPPAALLAEGVGVEHVVSARASPEWRTARIRVPRAEFMLVQQTALANAKFGQFRGIHGLPAKLRSLRRSHCERRSTTLGF